MTPNDDLLGFVSAVSGDTFLKVEENLGEGFVRLKVSEAERRQAKHDIRSVEDIVIELLRNARDAHARRIFVATSKEGSKRSLTVIDDGVGVPAAMHEHVFEPRVTSKLDSMVIDEWGVHGRGMALFSIRSNAQEARVAASDAHKGTSVTVVTDTAQLGERADQSSWPAVERTEDGTVTVARGPHNIVRRIVEFAVEHPGVDVYLGTPAEVLGTLYVLGNFEVDSSELMFCDDAERFPVWQRPATACDAAELTEIAQRIALPVSERTAHRVLAGEIPPLETVLAVALGVEETPALPATPDIYRDRRGLKLHSTDLADFKRELQSAFDLLSERYYLHLAGEPRITVGRDRITVRFDVEKED